MFLAQFLENKPLFVKMQGQAFQNYPLVIKLQIQFQIWTYDNECNASILTICGN